MCALNSCPHWLMSLPHFIDMLMFLTVLWLNTAVILFTVTSYGNSYDFTPIYSVVGAAEALSPPHQPIRNDLLPQWQSNTNIIQLPQDPKSPLLSTSHQFLSPTPSTESVMPPKNHVVSRETWQRRSSYCRMKQSLFNMIYSAGSIQHICYTYFVLRC